MHKNRRLNIGNIQKKKASGVISDKYHFNEIKVRHIQETVHETFKNKDADVRERVKPKNIRCCILCLAKNESRYLDEWVSYHSDLGFDRIFILDNNPFGEEITVKKENVTVIPYNGVDFKVFNVDQCAAYEYAIRYIKKCGFDAVLTLDVDEFLTFGNVTLDDVKKGFMDGTYNCVGFMWRIYTDSGYIYASDCNDTNNVLGTYTEPIPSHLERYSQNETMLAKPMFMLDDFVNFDNDPHKPMMSSDNFLVFDRGDAHIRHYRTKCLETFIIEKVLKRKADIAPFTGHGDRIVEGYFRFNTLTAEKKQAFIDICINNDYLLSHYDINLLSNENYFLKKKILVYTYLIGGYANRALFEGLLSNLRQYLEFDFDFFLVTDDRNVFGEYDGVTIVEVVTEKFDTIKEYKDYALAIKFKLFYENFDAWDDYSDIMFVNSNLRFNKNINFRFLYNGFSDVNRIVGTTHFMSRDSQDYLQASFWVSQSHFLRDILCPYIQRQLDKDNKAGVVAEWHDETYYNRLYMNNRQLWHVIDGYSNFSLIDKTELIGKEWDVHYNDILYNLDIKCHTVIDITLNGPDTKLSVLESLDTRGFTGFKIYCIKSRGVVTKSGLLKSDDMYFYHLPGDFLTYNDTLGIIKTIESVNKGRKLLIYAKK